MGCRRDRQGSTATLASTNSSRKTEAGSQFPLWEEAQRQFLSQIGTESLQELRALLTSAESAVTKAFTAYQEKP
jgi:hypothetical protein